uniref:F-box domain-containing protein n=1 Tax=Pithovirus LCPAC403 TaxID=2506596 RepID=A0A481ZBG2_9VIRU|nr:MAG: uncharacterized protein LCPAC403_04070 [Pithovirus LCPAC403]
MSVSEILAKIRLRKEDLNNLSLSLIQELFLELTPADISKLCVVSRHFNSFCNREPLWQNKVWADYGVNKKYEETWRKTANNMFIVGMINLNKKWINGRTYNKILETALNEGKDGATYLHDVQIDAVMDYMDYDIDDAGYLSFFPYEHNSENIRAFFTDEEYKEVDETIENMKIILSKEFAIIASVITILSRKYPLLPAAPTRHPTRTHYNPPPALTSIISKMIDPIPYIMQACAYVKNGQNDIIYKEY